MASQNPYPIIVYCVNNYRPHLAICDSILETLMKM